MSAESASLRADRTSRDRLLAMMFVAALLHGLLILGITFSTPLTGTHGAPGLRVLLVSDRLPPARRNATATYLAQRTELGAGNTRQAVQPHVATRRPAVPPGERTVQDDTAAPPGRPAHGGAEQVLTTTGWSTRVTYRIRSTPGALTGRFAPAAGGALAAHPFRATRLQGPQRQLWVSPDTRSSIVAPYLVAWRRKVERIGTLNFPAAARHAGAHAAPIIEVAIAADGRLIDARIRRSSGDPALDQAALAILRLASPFDPFPPQLARRYRVLRITYEWQFEGGRMRGSVSAP
jgi:protein TonB